MLLVESIYNVALLGINIVVCLYLLRRMSILGFATVLFLSLAASLAVGVLIGLHPFRMLRLTCWGWLLQAPLLCIAMAVIAWKKQAPGTALIGLVIGIAGIVIAVDSVIVEPRWLDVTEIRHCFRSGQ